MIDDYNFIEQEVMRTLHRIDMPLSAYEIARIIRASYPTVKKYLDDLAETGIVIKLNSRKLGRDGKPTSIYVFNYDIIK